jgi:hypothetical protein
VPGPRLVTGGRHDGVVNTGGVLTLLAGLGLACFGVVRWRQIRELRRTGVCSVGTVVGHE